MVEIKILRQAEEIHLQAGADAAVPRQEELAIAFSPVEECQIFRCIGQDDAFVSPALQPFQKLLLIVPAKGEDFFIGRHDTCRFIEQLLTNIVVRPTAGIDLRHRCIFPF